MCGRDDVFVSDPNRKTLFITRLFDYRSVL